MKAKDVIVGHEHRRGWDKVIVEDVRIEAAGTKAPRFRFLVRKMDEQQVIEVSAKTLGPALDAVEQRALAGHLMQPHRQLIEELHAPQVAKARQRAAEKGFGPHRSEWATHPVSDFSHLVMPKQHGQPARRFVEFNHTLELAMARRFDALQIQWSLEPKRFDLAGAAAFVPDFYLPEIDVYVEITSKRGEVKMHKLKGMAIYHPRVKVIALGGDSIEQMMGLGREQLIQEIERRAELERVLAKTRGWKALPRHKRLVRHLKRR